SLACSANVAAPPTVRAEGTTELTGDIVVTCTGGTPTVSGVDVPTVNFTVFMNTAVTSRLFAQNSAASNALLLIDEPHGATAQIDSTFLACPSAKSGCTIQGTGSGIGTYSGASGRFNIFQGVVSGNQVTFFGVPVDPPAAS